MGSSDNKEEIASDEPVQKKRKLIVSEKEHVQSSAKFDGSHFRRLIKGDNPVGAVRQLLAVLNNTNDDIIGDYLNCGGGALELVLALDKLDSKTYFHHYQPVFSALSLIIVKCRDEVPRLVGSAEEACRRLLRCHSPILLSMLAPSSTQVHKKAVLELLTGMVTLSIQLAREVLTSLSLREGTVNDLAKHSVKYELNSTRSHFIRFILAFFYHDSTHLVKQLLEQRNLLQCILHAGLTTDEAPLLAVFLRTLKEKIVDEITITKTSKLKMFNTKIMVKLLETYTWTGPKKNSKKDESIVVAEEEAEEVIEPLHQLLVSLCTNHKLGVAFVDPTVGLDQKKYNDLVFSVIKSMDLYWNISWIRDLALKIVLACPDLVAPTFRHLGLQEFFQPSVSLSFFNTCKFSKQVINSLVAERCLTATGSPDQLTHLTIRVVFNMNVLGCVRASLLHVHPTLRLLAIDLLNSMFQALQRFTNCVKARFSSAPKNSLDYNQRITDYITKNIGLEEELMVAWSLGVGGDQSLLKPPSDTEYFLPAIDLLLSYSELFPIYLPPVFVSKLQSTSLDTIDTNMNDLFRIKVIKFITMFKSTQPTQPEFSEMLTTLVPLLPALSEAKSVLRSLLMQSGLLEGLECEADAWVNNLSKFPGSNCVNHLPLLLAVIKEVVQRPKSCVKMLDKANTASDCADTGITKFDWSELIEVAKNPSKALTPWRNMLPNSRISVFVPALIKVLNNESVENLCSCKFMSHLLGDILYSQVDIKAFSVLVNTCTSHLVEPMRQYLDRLGDAEQNFNILNNQPFSKHSSQYYLLKTLSSANFSSDEPLKLLCSVDEESVSQLVREVVFYAVRATDPDMLHRCCRVVTALLSSSTPPSPSNSSTPSPPSLVTALEEVLLHPLVLAQFHPLHHPSATNLTPLLLSVIPFVSTEEQRLLDPYKERFLDQIQKAVKKKKKIKSCNLLEVCSKLISGQEKVSGLLETIVEFQPELDDWEEVTQSLLLSATSHKCLLPDQVVSVLSQQTSLHQTLAEYLNVFPHLLRHLDTEALTRKQEELSQLCVMLLRFDSEGSVQKKLLKNNKKSVAVLFGTVAAAGTNLDPAVHAQADHLISKMCEALTASVLPTWLANNANAIGKFVTQLSEAKCEEVCECLGNVQSWDNSHLSIAEEVYTKLGRHEDFVLKAVQSLVSLTSPDTLTRAEEVCKFARRVVERPVSQDCAWEQLRACKEWKQWQRLALKLGETSEDDNSFLLTTLAKLCAVVYAGDQEGVSVLAEMVFSHSQFLSVMLAKPSPTKTALLELILTLLQLDSSVMVSNHIPILLSAYSASLSAADQTILQLLQLYESHGLSATDWKPLLWGEAAVSHYSVRSQIAPGLWTRQNFSQLMELFDEHRVNLTISNFPIDRDLKPKNRMQEQSDIYDPAFYLPLLVSTFAPSELFFTYKTCQSGCLSLLLSALASHHKDVRLVAFVALQRFHAHLLSNRNNQDALWFHFLDALRRGLKPLSAPTAETDVVPRLSSVVAVFLSRACLILTNPFHPLYLPLSNYVLARPVFQLNCVPEFLPLFNSVDVQLQSSHQEWILNVLRDGMRDAHDFTLCLNSMVFKLLLEYHSSSMASEKAKVLILEILCAAVSVNVQSGQSAGSLLLGEYSLYPWLASVVRHTLLTDSEVIAMASLLGRIQHPSSAGMLSQLTCRPNLTEQQLTAVLAALCHSPHSLPVSVVRHLVTCAENILGTTAFQCRSMLDNGIEYVDDSSNKDDLCGYLKRIIFRMYQNES